MDIKIHLPNNVVILRNQGSLAIHKIQECMRKGEVFVTSETETIDGGFTYRMIIRHFNPAMITMVEFIPGE